MGLLAVGTSVVGRRWPATRPVLEGRPSVVGRDGVLIDEALSLLRMTAEEVEEAARTQGYDSTAGMSWIIVEADGKFSFVEGRPSDPERS
jgi:uncharacterized membrane protein YcaP (DUF421 family)